MDRLSRSVLYVALFTTLAIIAVCAWVYEPVPTFEQCRARASMGDLDSQQALLASCQSAAPPPSVKAGPPAREEL